MAPRIPGILRYAPIKVAITIAYSLRADIFI